MMRAVIFALVLAGPLNAQPVPQQSLQDGITLYAAGKTVEAAAVYAMLARQGNAEAQFNLALLYYTGQGVPHDVQAAFALAWQAKLQGIVQSQALIDRLDDKIAKPERMALLKTLDVRLDPKVYAGDAKAMIARSLLYAELADPADPVQTYVWLGMAVALGLDAALPLRDKIFYSLSKPDRQKAQKHMRDTFQSWCAKAQRRPASCDL